MPWSEFPLTPDDQHDITHYAAEGLRLLEVDQSATPIAIVQAIGAQVHQQRHTIAQADEESYAFFILSMGYLWGQQVSRAYGWEWSRVGEEEESAGHAIVSPIAPMSTTVA